MSTEKNYPTEASEFCQDSPIRLKLLNPPQELDAQLGWCFEVAISLRFEYIVHA